MNSPERLKGLSVFIPMKIRYRIDIMDNLNF